MIIATTNTNDIASTVGPICGNNILNEAAMARYLGPGNHETLMIGGSKDTLSMQQSNLPLMLVMAANGVLTLFSAGNV